VRFHAHPVRAGDLTHFLMRLIICCLLINLLGQSAPRRELWTQPFLQLYRPGDGCGIRSEFARQFAPAFEEPQRQYANAVADGTSPDTLLLLRPGPDGIASAILFLINCSSFILYGVTALFGRSSFRC